VVVDVDGAARVAIAAACVPELGERGGENVDDEVDRVRPRLRSLSPPPPLLPGPYVPAMERTLAIEALSYGCGRLVTLVTLDVVDIDVERGDMA
jgi:hypothetical protein